MEQLTKPFPEKDIEWRVQSNGWSGDKPWAMVLAYVTARAIQDRLDEVFGAFNWKDEYKHITGGVLCSISIKDNNGEWVSKQDGSPETQVEAFKGGISKAMVRCAVKWGIGRYLYKLPITFAECSATPQKGWNKQYDSKTKKTFYWKTPLLPAMFLPDHKPKKSKEYSAQSLLEDKIKLIQLIEKSGQVIDDKVRNWVDKADALEINAQIERLENE